MCAQTLGQASATPSPNLGREQMICAADESVKGAVMMRLISIAKLLCLALLLTGCSDPEHDPTLGEPGPHGEPGPGLQQVHSIEFRVREADYFAALTEFYEFGHVEAFDIFQFGECFGHVLGSLPGKEFEPCIGMYALKGGPTKAHMTFTILATSLNRLDRNDFITCRIGIYVHSTYPPVASIGPNFASRVDEKLRELDARVAAAIPSQQ